MRLAALFAVAACSSPSNPVSADAAQDASPDALMLDRYGCPPYPVDMISIADGDTAYTPKELGVGQGVYIRFVTSSMHDMHFFDMAGQQELRAPIGFSTTQCIYFPHGPEFFHITCSVHGEIAMLMIANPGP
jgi:plastocyanin